MPIRLASRTRIPSTGRPARTTLPSVRLPAGMPEWVTTGSLTGITFGTPRLGGTFETIDVELPFTETTGTIQRAYLEVRKADLTQAARFSAADMHAIRPLAGAETTAYGAETALYFPIAGWLVHNTAYEVRAHVGDALGNWAIIRLGTVTTRAENIPAAASLVPTHYVRTGGSDAANGTSAGTAWETLYKASSTAPANAIVQVGPGYYVPPSSTPANPAYLRTTPITFVAEHPAVDDDGVAINGGQQSVIEGILVSAPTSTPVWSSAVSQNKYVVAPWVAVQLQGPGQTLAGGTYAAPTTPIWHGTNDPTGNGTPNGTIWKWAGTVEAPLPALQTNVISTIGYAATRADIPRMIAWQHHDSGVLSTPGGWAEIVDTNVSYHGGGVWQDSQANNGDLYLRLPPNAPGQNPNDLWIIAGDTKFGLSLSTNDATATTRVSGLAFHSISYGVQIHHAVKTSVIDHCLFGNCFIGPRLGDASINGQDLDLHVNNAVIQNNLIVNYNLWDEDGDAIPWWTVKSNVFLANGLQLTAANGYPTVHTRFTIASETQALHGRGGSVRTVFRDNVVDGTFNGVMPQGPPAGNNRYAGYGSAIYRNIFRHIPDDVYEYDERIINVVAFDNDVENSAVYCSLGPTDCGPILHFRERIWRIGRQGMGRFLVNDPGMTSGLFKHSGSSTPKAIFHLYHFTMWCEDDESGSIIAGLSEAANPGTAEESFRFRNGIIRVTGDPIDRQATQTVDIDYCTLVTTATATFGLRWRTASTSTRHRTTAAYRAESGQGAHANVVNGVTIDPTDYVIVDALLVSPIAGDLALTVAGQAQLVGEPIPGISDALGRTPRIGYQP
jgi:hypothetical protein